MPARKGSPTARRLTPEGAARRARIVQMRRAKLSWREIGDREGISSTMASRIYREALAEVPAHQIDEHRAEELEFYDLAVNRLLTIAMNTAESGRTRVEAWNSIRGWAERKAKLLGLDAPQRTEVITLTAIDAEIRKLEAELAATDAEDDELADA